MFKPFKTTGRRPDTPMEKTTRAVTNIIGGETEKRQTNTARLRKERLEMEAGVTEKVVPPKAKRARKKPPLKAIK